MNMQNYASNLFYSLQFSFIFDGWSVEQMEREDPTPDWFLDWWKIYGLSALITKPYSLSMLKIYGFSEPRAHQSGIFYKSVQHIADIEDLHFYHGVKGCGHVCWFVTNIYKVRLISTNYDDSQPDYEDFHERVNPEQNPFENLNFLSPPDNNPFHQWESEK